MKQDKIIWLLILGLIISAVIRIWFILDGLAVGDVKMMAVVADLVTSGQNPYLIPDSYIYPPLWMYVEILSSKLYQLTQISFFHWIKFWPNLADLIITLLIYRLLIKQGLRQLPAVLWSLFFIFNPIAIIISSAHGQFDAIPSLLVVVALYLHLTKHKLADLWIPLSLGLAIAFKPNPVLLVPLFLFIQKRTLTGYLRFMALTSLPTLLSLIPFMLTSLVPALGSIISYSGVYDFGYLAIVRGIYWQDNASHWLANAPQLLGYSKLAFLAVYLPILIYLIRQKNLVQGCLVIYLLFLTVYGGISAQYLAWILPLAVLQRDRWLWVFSLTAVLAMLGFYLFFAPEILLGKSYFYGGFFESKYIPLYTFGNLWLWLASLGWLIKLLIPKPNH